MTITPEQCRMARAALGLTVRDLAKIADMSPNTITRLEGGESMHSRTLKFVRGVFEAEGIILIDAGKPSVLGGPGIRTGGGQPMSAMGKLFDAMWNATDATYSDEKIFAAALDIVEAYLNIIAGEGREPDTWERINLNDALRVLQRGHVYYASSYIRVAINPPDNQSKDYPIPEETVREYETCNMAYFRKGVGALRQRGYRAPNS